MARRGGVPRHIVAQRRGDGSARRQRGAPSTRVRFACHSRDDANSCDGEAGRFHVNAPARGKTGSGTAMTTGTVGAATIDTRAADVASQRHLTATTHTVRAYALQRTATGLPRAAAAVSRCRRAEAM